MKKSVSPAVGNGGGCIIGNFGNSRRIRHLVFIALVFAMAALFRLNAHDLVAVTKSGKTFVISEVEKDIETLTITFRNLGITMSDPVVDLSGLDELTRLRELSFYHVPQIASFQFLSECVSVRRLIISLARVRSVGFLGSLQNLELLHLEICGDWDSDNGLPFLEEPLDLIDNNRLEYLAFRACDLQRVPEIINIPKALRVFDISYNVVEIDQSDIPALEALRQVDRIYINGNTIGQPILAAYRNIQTENSDTLLSTYLDE